MYLDGIRVLRVQFAPLIYRHLYIDLSAEPPLCPRTRLFVLLSSSSSSL